VSEPVTFLASFPNIQTAIRVAGDGGARILLDIPEDEMPAIVRLMLMRGQVIRVTVEPEKQEATQPARKVQRWDRKTEN
jgi:hypothetical protein